jgi:hypothetical protein
LHEGEDELATDVGSEERLLRSSWPGRFSVGRKLTVQTRLARKQPSGCSWKSGQKSGLLKDEVTQLAKLKTK